MLENTHKETIGVNAGISAATWALVFNHVVRSL